MRLAIVMLPLMLMLVGCAGAGVSSVRIAPLLKTEGDEGETCAYSLHIQSPWEQGGYFTLNYPEHLEFGPVGYTITRYSDPIPSAWKLERDGKLVWYDVDSIPGRGVRGVKVASRVEVIEPGAKPRADEPAALAGTNRLRFSLKISNHSTRTLDNVKPLLCFQYKHLAGFSGHLGENFKYTYVVFDGKITALADVKTEREDPERMGAFVRGVTPFRYDFARKGGGYIGKPMDLGLAVISSEDSQRALIIYTPVGRSMLSNRWIPCLHLDPHFEHLKPGESKERIQHVIFAGEDWREIVKKLIAQHKGTTIESTEGPIYFSSPQEAVERISAMLRRKDWGKLARYYDLTDTPIDRATLNSGEFFYTDKRPEAAHPAGFWHYKHPFAPGFKFDSVRKLETPGVIEVTVKVEIDQGDGTPQRGIQTFLMRRSDKGYQVMPHKAPVS